MTIPSLYRDSVFGCYDRPLSLQTAGLGVFRELAGFHTFPRLVTKLVVAVGISLAGPIGGAYWPEPCG